MFERICYLFGAGDFTGFPMEIHEHDLVLAADGGYDYALRLGVPIDLVIGDFDSIHSGTISEQQISYPAEKDDTDLLLALKYGLQKEYRKFEIFGGLGGRFDHSLANLQALSFLNEHGAVGTLYGEHYRLTTIKDGSLTLPTQKNGYVSIFSLSDQSEGVTIQNLKYTVQDIILKRTFPIGVSNAFIGEPAFISVKSGTLAILWYDETHDINKVVDNHF